MKCLICKRELWKNGVESCSFSNAYCTDCACLALDRYDDLKAEINRLKEELASREPGPLVPEKCPICEGSGEVMGVLSTCFGKCPRCSGTGLVCVSECQPPKGEGK